jgi:hypothetical protein
VGLWLRTSCIVIVALSLAPRPAEAQRLVRVGIGSALGVAGGVAITAAAVTFRARFMGEYLLEPEDLIHWQSAPMIGAPAAGILFGWLGEEELKASIVGSVGGLAVGAAVGAGLGRALASDLEAPWAGGIIGGGLGMTVGGLTAGLLAWRRGERAEGAPLPPPIEVVLLRVPL